MSKLTSKQEKFCNEYLIDLNATQAAIRAGYSVKTAKQIGTENLSKPIIAAKIAESKEIRNKRIEIDQDFVIKNLMKAMKISLGEEDTYVVGNFDGTTDSMPMKKTDIANFLKVQDMLAKHTGLYEKDNEQSNGGLEIIQPIVISDELAKKLNTDLEDEC